MRGPEVESRLAGRVGPFGVPGGPSKATLSRRQFLAGGLVGAAGLAAGAAASGCAATGAGPEAPQHLTVDGLASPIGLGPDDIYFGWHVGDRRRGALQGAYRVVVSGPVRGGGTPTVWDSGKVSSAEQAFVGYGGYPLSADDLYRWTVQTWDQHDRSGPFAPMSSFETGLRDSDWRAKWIRRVRGKPAQPNLYTYARREFRLKPVPVTRARVYVSGDQQYELYVNGVRAGKGQAYSFPDTSYYETLDVTHLLRRGSANAVAVVLSWDGPTKGHPSGQPGLIAQISVHHQDGSHQVTATDGSWRVRKGPWLPGTQRDLEGDLVDYTENIDGRDEPVGWRLPGFDDSGWAPAVVVGPAGTRPWTSLVSVRTRIVEEPVRPVSLTTLSSGAVVADFGRIFAARPTVQFNHGVAGRLVTMRAGYLLDEPAPGQAFTGVPGQVSTVHGTQHTDMSYSYVQRGGVEAFRAFDYLGFRYFQIDDPGEPLTADDVTILARHTAVPDTHAASFTSSDATVDAEFELGRHSALYTAQEQYIDTPTREKGPWLWDGFNESETALVAFGEQNLTRKSLQEFAQSQRRFWPNGAVNKIYPTGLGALDINEYTEIYPEWVWRYWTATSDKALLSEVYPVMSRVSDYVQHSVDHATGLVKSLPSTNVYYSFPVVTRLNVLGVNVFRRVGDTAQALDRPVSEVDAQRQRERALRKAVNRHLLRGDGVYVDGLQADGSQTPQASQETNACAVAYDVAPASASGAVAAYVASLGMQAPPRTAAEVLRTLAVAGRYRDLVARLDDPLSNGWANILARGGTFTWEVWQPSDLAGDSMSHGWGANVLVEIQRSLLGVRASSPGYASFDVRPPATVLSGASGRVPTPRGPIMLAWRRPSIGQPRFTLDLSAPPNSVAKVRLPAARADSVTEGGRSLGQAEGVALVSSGSGEMTLRVGSGTYSFTSLPGG